MISSIRFGTKQSHIRMLFLGILIFGIFLIYFDTVILHNFNILTTEGGPDTTDYFLSE